MVIKKLILFYLILISHSVFSNTMRDTLVDHINEYTLKSTKLSSNGNWAIITEKNKNKLDSIYLVNTKTKVQSPLIKFAKHEFIKNHLITFKNSTLKIKNLNTLENGIITDVNKYTLLDDSNQLVHLSKNKMLTLVKIKQQKNILQSIDSVSDVDNYFLNDDKNQFLLLKKGALYLYRLDNLRLDKIVDIEDEIQDVKWQREADTCLVITKKQEAIYINTKSHQVTPIKLPENETKVVFFQTVLPYNGDVLFIRVIEQKPVNSFATYLDIWNGNDQYLNKKGFDESVQNSYKEVYLYNHSTKALQLISFKENKDFFYINSPTKLLLYETAQINNYSTYKPNIKLSIFDINTQQIKELDQSISWPSNHLSFSPKGTHIVYKKNTNWKLYDIEKDRTILLDTFSESSQLYWSKNNEMLYAISHGDIWLYNIKTQNVSNLTNFKTKNEISILNTIGYDNMPLQDISPRIIKQNEPLVFIQKDKNTNSSNLYLQTKNKLSIIHSNTSNKITDVQASHDYKKFIFTQENFNLPTTVFISNLLQVDTLLQNKTPKNLYNWKQQKIIAYKDKNGTPLKGILYYPKEFQKNRKYPMITSVYEEQSHRNNYYTIPSDTESTGYNITSMQLKNYFVFLPDTHISEEDGPGISAVNCVTRAIKTVSAIEPAIDTENLGIIGNSYGGYLVNFIITQTDLFKTAISGVAVSDIIWDYNSYNYNFPKPSYWKYENGQYGIKKSLKDARELYLKNNPILFADQVNTPLLSYTGYLDENVPWENTRHFYIALKRYNKKQIALFYKKDGHAILGKESALDINKRILDWFDYFLKDNKDYAWINQGLN